jgi:hypothetical protein
MSVPVRLATALLLALGLPSLSHACAACGCTLNADWASQGFTVGPGLRLDLRTEYWNQNQLWSGSQAVSAAAFPLGPDQQQEIQQKTITRQTTLGLDYTVSYDWGVNLSLPWLDRDHSTTAPGDTDLTGSHFSGIGDARVLFRYQGLGDDNHSGLQAGLKLPTGAFDRSFGSGAQAGEALDRGLQAGTGTTDALLGAYHNGQLNDVTGYFVQAQAQLPLNSRNDFRPGRQFNASLGLRYLDSMTFTPLLQLNLHAEGRESGVNADADNSGLRQVFLSPGLDVRVNNHLGGFAFVQLPVYQHANGLQLLPRSLFSAGLHYRF